MKSISALYLSSIICSILTKISPVHAIKWSLTSSSCTGNPSIRNVKVTCNGVEGSCGLGDVARIQATVTAKRSFDNEWIKIQLCEFGYCSRSMYKNGKMTSTYKNGGQICDWLTVTEDEEEEEQEAQQREQEEAERSSSDSNDQLEYFYRMDSSTGRFYRMYRYGDGGRTLYYRYKNNNKNGNNCGAQNNKNGNNYRVQYNNNYKNGNYYSEDGPSQDEPSQDVDEGYYKRDGYSNYYRVNREGEPEDEPEEEREFQCGDPGTYILDHTFEIPTKDDLPTGWSWLFKSTGSINITVGLEKECETYEFTFSSVGIASFVLIGAGAYAEKKRRSKKRSNDDDDHIDDKSTQYLEMGGMAVV